MTEIAGKDERTWAMLCHLGALIGYFLPFGNIVLPLAIWLWKRKEFPLVEDQGKESLNFQISMTLYLLAVGVLAAIPGLLSLAGSAFLGLAIFAFGVVTIAAIRAKRGDQYRYPLTLVFVR